MHRNPETLTSFFSSSTKHLLTFLTFSFLTRGERGHYADCSIWPNKCAVHPIGPTGLASPRLKKQTSLAQRQISTNCFFKKSTKFPASHFRSWRHSQPSLISYLGFLLWHLWLSHPPRSSVNCTQCVHLHVH